MSLPNRLQNLNSNTSKAISESSTSSVSDSRLTSIESNNTNKLPISLDTSEEEGQLYIDVAKYVTYTIAKYKMSQIKQFFSESLHKNSQYNDEGFQ